MDNTTNKFTNYSTQQIASIISRILNPNTVVVVSTAPAPRTALSEPFGETENAQGKIVGFLKSLGIDYVFDTTLGADLTTICEARELLYRLKNNSHLPLLNSCCPTFVKYIENFYPALKDNLSTTLTPIANMGAYIKGVFAKEIGINPKNIYHIALTPCVAKKFEITKNNFTLKLNKGGTKYKRHSKTLSNSSQHLIQNIIKNCSIPEIQSATDNASNATTDCVPLTDLVITTNELATLINLSEQKYSEIQPELCNSITGNTIQFGHSGGVVKSVIECAYYLLNNSPPPTDFFNFTTLDQFVYTANVKLGEFELKIAKIDGLKNWEQFVKNYNISDFAFIEVMTCVGGCLGGTGQPKPAKLDVRKSILLQTQAHTATENTFALELIKNNPNLFINE